MENEKKGFDTLVSPYKDRAPVTSTDKIWFSGHFTVSTCFCLDSKTNLTRCGKFFPHLYLNFIYEVLLETRCEKAHFSSCKWELRGSGSCDWCRCPQPVQMEASRHILWDEFLLYFVVTSLFFFFVFFFFLKWKFKAKLINSIASLPWQSHLFDKVSFE